MFLLLFAFLPLCSPLVPVLGKALSMIVAAELAVMRFSVALPSAVVEDFWSRKAEPQVVVYNNWRCPALHVIASPSQSWLLMPEPDSLETGMHYVAESFWRKRLTADPVVLTDMTSLDLEGIFTAVMISDDFETATHRNADGGDAPAFVALDVLWITKGYKGNRLNGLELLYRPRLVVLDAALPRWQRTSLRQDAERVGWSVYDVADSGAFKMGLNDF